MVVMNLEDMVAALGAEIGRLRQARALLSDLEAAPSARRGRPKSAAASDQPPTRPKRNLSPEARARIAAAQKARWAKRHSES